MEIKYYSKKFSELDIGETFVEIPSSKSIMMKISDCSSSDPASRAVNLNTGEVSRVFERTTTVYPIKCHLMRSI